MNAKRCRWKGEKRWQESRRFCGGLIKHRRSAPLTAAPYWAHATCLWPPYEWLPAIINRRLISVTPTSLLRRLVRNFKPRKRRESFRVVFRPIAIFFHPEISANNKLFMIVRNPRSAEGERNSCGNVSTPSANIAKNI